MRVRVRELFELRIGHQVPVQVKAIHDDHMFRHFRFEQFHAFDIEKLLQPRHVRRVNAHLNRRARDTRHVSLVDQFAAQGMTASKC